MISYKEILFNNRIRFIFFFSLFSILFVFLKFKFFNLLVIKIIFLYTLIRCFFLIFGLFEIRKEKHYQPLSEFPIYSIIVALYKEKNTLKQLFESLEEINYPKDKLQILIAIEEDDLETINALKTINISFNIKIINVPFFYPRTKPKALNYTISYVKGEFLAIYDAEDKINKNQLIDALNLFYSDHKKEYAALQGILLFYNRNHNNLTRCFHLEYFSWFFFTISSLSKIFNFIPLGGSTNHFRVSALREVNGWDSFNVTEDLDISVKLMFNNYKIGFLNSVTEEQCPQDLKSWLKQRSRWIKGYIITYFKYFFQSFNLNYREFLIYHLFVGLSWFNFFSVPCLIFNFDELIKKTYLIYLILFYVIIFILLIKTKFFNKLKSFILLFYFPMYFLLHIIATYIAIIEILSSPFYWNKTKHLKIKNNS